MEKIVVFTKDYLDKVSLRIKDIAKNISNEPISLNQHTLLKITPSGKCQHISQGQEAFATFNQPNQDNYIYILFVLPEQIPQEITENKFSWKNSSNNDFVLVHQGDMRTFEYKGISFENIKKNGCQYEEFSSEKGGSWPDFEKLVDSIDTDKQKFQDTLNTLFGMSKEKLLISMKILFLPAYLVLFLKEEPMNVDWYHLSFGDWKGLQEVRLTTDGENLRSDWSNSLKTMSYFGGEGEEKLKFKEGKDTRSNFRDKYRTLCDKYRDLC